MGHTVYNIYVYNILYMIHNNILYNIYIYIYIYVYILYIACAFMFPEELCLQGNSILF